MTRIAIEYALDHPRHLPVQELLDLEVGLRAGEDGVYEAPRPVDRTVRMRLSSLPRDAELGASALLHINQYLVSTFNRRGYNGVIVTVPDIEEGSGRDLRAPGDTTLRLRIWTGRVTRVTSIADGERFGGLGVDERTNHAAHAWIRERSPVRPGGPRAVLSVVALEDFAAEMSRHPGRRVEVELEPGARAGTTAVNLRVAENKPWVAYAQYRNTGTDSTTRNRERFGFVHEQLTSRDDILALDYITGDFDEVHAFLGSYEAPFDLDAPEWRFAVRALASRFDTREAGFTDTGLRGRQLSAGAEVSRQLWQHRALFLDAAVGADWERLWLENRQLDGLDARVDYALPQAELRIERDTTVSTLRARVGVLAGFTDAGSGDDLTGEPPEIDVFGTLDADEDFALARLDASWAFYLEPLLFPRAWQDPSTPGSSTLAHEVAFLARGQWALGHRLIPQYQEVAGGFDTVRGYRQSVVVGDNLIAGTAEYRLHLPRLFDPSDRSPPTLPGLGAFRIRPRHVYDLPDWDLVLRVFGDAAHLRASDALDAGEPGETLEPDETLLSVGGGLELRVMRFVTLRADVGHTLADVERTARDESGETRAHLAATVLY